MVKLLHFKFVSFIDSLAVKFNQQELGDLTTVGTNVTIRRLVVINDGSYLEIHERITYNTDTLQYLPCEHVCDSRSQSIPKCLRKPKSVWSYRVESSYPDS